MNNFWHVNSTRQWFVEPNEAEIDALVGADGGRIDIVLSDRIPSFYRFDQTDNIAQRNWH